MDNSTNEDGYQVERAPDVAGTPGTFAQIGANLPANSKNYTDTIVAGIIYHYRLEH